MDNMIIIDLRTNSEFNTEDNVITNHSVIYNTIENLHKEYINNGFVKTNSKNIITTQLYPIVVGFDLFHYFDEIVIYDDLGRLVFTLGKDCIEVEPECEKWLRFGHNLLRLYIGGLFNYREDLPKENDKKEDKHLCVDCEHCIYDVEGNYFMCNYGEETGSEVDYRQAACRDYKSISK